MLEINTQLIRQAQQGDRMVIAELYRHYYLNLFHFLYYRVGDRQTAEDLTSEVFLRMLNFIGSFNPPSSTFGSWLFEIARNLATTIFDVWASAMMLIWRKRCTQIRTKIPSRVWSAG
jgi:RNA polymerase sigma factor (sigma-70 family)